MTKFIKTLIGTILVTGALMQANADDQKVDPTGTYIWTMPGRNGGPDRTNTLELKVDAGALTGKLSSPGRGGKINETKIADGKVTGAEVSFIIVRTFNDNTMTNKFAGTLTNGAIVGKIEFQRDGETQSRKWEAKKQPDAK